MAFTGTAVFEQITDRMVRITGLSLAGAAAGTISLSGGTGQVKLPHAFKPVPYKYDGHAVSFSAAIKIITNPAGSVTTSVPIEITKAGTGPADFLATLTNTTAATASPALEIYVEFHE